MIWNNLLLSYIGKAESFPLFITNNSLVLTLGLPLFSLFILFLTSGYNPIMNQRFALISTGISFFLSVYLLYRYNRTIAGFQLTYAFQLIPSLPMSLRFGVDGISIFFIVLTNLFIFLCILNLDPQLVRLKESILHVVFLQWAVIGSFLLLDILGFFLFFEMTLIPIYFLVLIWGSRERRIRASYLISIYTLLGSIFMFFNIIYLIGEVGTCDYEFLLADALEYGEQAFLWITFFISFAAKIPLFPLHIWLPEAHVEAPTLGSVLLAVLLLKLGTYAVIRFSLPLFAWGTSLYNSISSSLSVMGIIFTSITAIIQIDLKKIIAYSSVGHMNTVLLGLLSETSEGMTGGIFQMISHGVVSGALFFGVGCIYERYSARSLKYFGGLATLYPVLAFVFLIFAMSNISFPLTSSFVGEFLIFMGLYQQSFWATFFAATSMVLGAVYMLWTYNRIFFGNVKNEFITSFKDLNSKEIHLFAVLIFCVFLMGIFSYIFLDMFLVDVLNVLEQAYNTSSVSEYYFSGIFLLPTLRNWNLNKKNQL